MGAPAGNQNAAKAKQWAAAIERALERLGDPSIDPDSPVERSPKIKALDELAALFVGRVKGEPGFNGFKEFGDRMDGKAAQQLQLQGDENNPLVTKIVREVVKPSTEA